jgi:hypothetical protein
MTGHQSVYNAAWGTRARWVSIEDPGAVDPSAIDWDTVLGAETDDYQIYTGPT